MFPDEIQLLDFLSQQITAHIPVYKYKAKDDTWGGYPLVKGESLTVSKYKKFSSTQKQKLAQQLGNFLSELHDVPLAKLKSFFLAERQPIVELQQLEKDAKKYLYPTLSMKEKTEYQSFFSHLDYSWWKKYKKVLIHGDLSGNHILLDSKNKLAGVIDFSDRSLHDPAFDFIFLWRFGQEFVQMVYEAYRPKNKVGILERSEVYSLANRLWSLIQNIKKAVKGYQP